jgi:hypothetical protein
MTGGTRFLCTNDNETEPQIYNSSNELQGIYVEAGLIRIWFSRESCDEFNIEPEKLEVCCGEAPHHLESR